MRIDGLTGIDKAAAFLIMCDMQGKLLWNGHLPYIVRRSELTADGKLLIEFGKTVRPSRGSVWGDFVLRSLYESASLKPLLRKLRKLRCKKK